MRLKMMMKGSMKDSDITEACVAEAPYSYDEMVWDYFED